MPSEPACRARACDRLAGGPSAADHDRAGTASCGSERRSPAPAGCAAGALRQLPARRVIARPSPLTRQGLRAPGWSRRRTGERYSDRSTDQARQYCAPDASSNSLLFDGAGHERSPRSGLQECFTNASLNVATSSTCSAGSFLSFRFSASSRLQPTALASSILPSRLGRLERVYR